jgi:hypothetical protein
VVKKLVLALAIVSCTDYDDSPSRVAAAAESKPRSNRLTASAVNGYRIIRGTRSDARFVLGPPTKIDDIAVGDIFERPEAIIRVNYNRKGKVTDIVVGPRGRFFDSHAEVLEWLTLGTDTSVRTRDGLGGVVIVERR